MLFSFFETIVKKHFAPVLIQKQQIKILLLQVLFRLNSTDAANYIQHCKIAKILQILGIKKNGN